MVRIGRRRLLSVIAAGAATGTIAGCQEKAENGPEDHCRFVDYRYLSPEVEDRSILTDGLADPFLGFSLTLTPDTLEGAGAEFDVTLSNESDRELETYSKDRYVVQSSTDDGWQTITGVQEDVEFDDQRVVHEPNDGFTWNLSVGTRVGSLVEEPYAVCTTPIAGEYRFVFWGFPSDPENTPLALASEFTIVDS